jgi:eukaryotic-like serine/threonine-protein kinase
VSQLTTGLRLDDRFVLRECVGVGGMSQVWRAEDLVLDRPVALKVLNAALIADPDLHAATWTEARAAARLTHPNVTQIYDYGHTRLPDGTALTYLVMEFVEGHTLAERLRSGPLPWQAAVSVCAQVATGLAAAHRIGVVHRDIKPGNVMLTATGAKVLDFGIAALVGGRPAAEERLIGTPAYAAPELLRPGPAVPHSDVYALGVVLYETLTGHTPLRLDTWREAVAAHENPTALPPLDVPGLPRQVRRVCMACLSRDPAERPDAADLAQALTSATGHPTATAVLPAVALAPPATSHEPHPGYTVGSAAVPPSPTMIDSRYPLPLEAPPAEMRRTPRPLLIALIALVAVLGLALAVVTGSLLSRQTQRPQAGPASTATAPPASPSPAAPSSVVPTATTVPAIADALDTVISDAAAAGRIDNDTADNLRERVNQLRDGHSRKKMREQAQQFQDKVTEMASQGALDHQTADQMVSLLQQLSGSD